MDLAQSWHMGRHADPEDFDRLAAEFPERVLVELLGVERKTIRRWRRGVTRVPLAYYRLLYEHSSCGLAERDSAENFQRHVLVELNGALERKVDALQAELIKLAGLVDWGAANDPFIHPDDPKSKAMTG